MINIDNEISDSFFPINKKVFNEFAETAKAISQSLKDMPDSIQVLAENGWFVPESITPGSLNFYAEQIKENNFEIVNNGMIELLDSEMVFFEKLITERFPHRKSVLNSSFKAHRQEDYYLSTPVFFAQTEGICKELTGFRYFSIKKNQPITKRWVSNFILDSFIEMLLSPLKNKDITRQNQIPDKPLGINRHDVLHGDSYDYGEDKTNSYKALSLLFYMAETVYNSNEKLLNKTNL